MGPVAIGVEADGGRRGVGAGDGRKRAALALALLFAFDMAYPWARASADLLGLSSTTVAMMRLAVYVALAAIAVWLMSRDRAEFRHHLSRVVTNSIIIVAVVTGLTAALFHVFGPVMTRPIMYASGAIACALAVCVMLVLGSSRLRRLIAARMAVQSDI